MGKANSNQLYINHGTQTYICRSCDRRFSTENGALNHCQHAQTHQGEWCGRCQRLFVSPAARHSHVSSSSYHHLCDPCDLDYSTAKGLEDHDVDIHNMCRDCGRFFANANQLQQVSPTRPSPSRPRPHERPMIPTRWQADLT
jgi:hypothetical protein